ncbi:MAG: acyltransferase family protein [Flaviflexus sp.]|nr:acyltransferase family protein [Flaviflexus sp.]
MSDLPPQLTPFRDERKFRTELHGVRGLAIALVVAFHIFGHGRVSGGIDVFLAITGFLALPSLARRAQLGRGAWMLNVPQRLAGLARRLVVPLVPVLLMVITVSWVIFPLTTREQTLREVRAAALFYENWELVFSQLTYDAAGPMTSPLQHLWSTSIQGQFHLVMIFFVMAVALFAKVSKLDMKLVLVAVLAVITGASFAWAAHDTAESQASAYFSTFSRAWQLTGPGILGLLVTSIALPPLVRGIMSWIGFLLITTCGMVMDGALWFPGPRALWPIAGICLVLAAGETRTWWGADRVLATWPFQRVGDISYHLYLWHWPILIFSLNALGRQETSLLLAAGVLAISFTLGTIGYALFERELGQMTLFRHPYLPAAIGACSAILVALTATSGMAYTNKMVASQLEETLANADNILGDGDYPGAAVLVGADEPPVAPIIPAADVRARDVPWHYEVHKKTPCVQRKDPTEVLICQHPELSSGPLVVLVGGSHVGQWAEAIAEIAEEHGWRLITMERSGCHLTTDARGARGGRDLGQPCADWNKNVMVKLAEVHPSLVIAQITTRFTNKEIPTDEVEFSHEGMQEAIKSLNDQGIPTFLFRENATAEKEMLACVAGTPDQIRNCTEPRNHFYEEKFDGAAAEDFGLDPEMSFFFDVSPYLCTEDTCFSEIGNVRVFRDDDHLSATLTRTIRPYIDVALTGFRPELY